MSKNYSEYAKYIYIKKKKKYVLAAFGLHQICKTEREREKRMKIVKKKKRIDN